MKFWFFFLGTLAENQPFLALRTQKSIESAMPLYLFKSDICKFVDWARKNANALTEQNKEVLLRLRMQNMNDIRNCAQSACDPKCISPLNAPRSCLNDYCSLNSAFDIPEIAKSFKPVVNREDDKIVVVTSGRDSSETLKAIQATRIVEPQIIRYRTNPIIRRETAPRKIIPRRIIANPGRIIIRAANPIFTKTIVAMQAPTTVIKTLIKSVTIPVNPPVIMKTVFRPYTKILQRPVLVPYVSTIMVPVLEPVKRIERPFIRKTNQIPVNSNSQRYFMKNQMPMIAKPPFLKQQPSRNVVIVPEKVPQMTEKKPECRIVEKIRLPDQFRDFNSAMCINGNDKKDTPMPMILIKEFKMINNTGGKAVVPSKSIESTKTSNVFVNTTKETSQYKDSHAEVSNIETKINFVSIPNKDLNREASRLSNPIKIETVTATKTVVLNEQPEEKSKNSTPIQEDVTKTVTKSVTVEKIKSVTPIQEDVTKTVTKSVTVEKIKKSISYVTVTPQASVSTKESTLGKRTITIRLDNFNTDDKSTKEPDVKKTISKEESFFNKNSFDKESNKTNEIKSSTNENQMIKADPNAVLTEISKRLADSLRYEKIFNQTDAEKSSYSPAIEPPKQQDINKKRSTVTFTNKITVTVTKGQGKEKDK